MFSKRFSVQFQVVVQFLSRSLHEVLAQNEISQLRYDTVSATG
jgi:hypothetical protein